MIFVDADYFIGLYNKKDAHHNTCLRLAKKIKEELITSSDVIDEVATKLSYYLEKNLAIRFLDDIIKKKLIIIYSSPSLLTTAINIFKKQPSKRVSLTDCMNMAIAKEKGVQYFLSFDSVYEKNKFKLVK